MLAGKAAQQRQDLVPRTDLGEQFHLSIGGAASSAKALKVEIERLAGEADLAVVCGDHRQREPLTAERGAPRDELARGVDDRRAVVALQRLLEPVDEDDDGGRLAIADAAWGGRV